MTEIRNKLTEAATALGEEAASSATHLQACAKDTWDKVQDQTGRIVDGSSTYVRENPVPTVVAAVGFGLVLGMLLSRREPASFTERCIQEPLHRSRGVLFGLVVALGALLKRSVNSASSAAEELTESLGEDFKETMEPLARAAKRNGRKLRL